ncbi:MAG: 4Fe-4S dicluster domain-containing protein [Anaerolineales bacterium]|jgi:ferredoxin
MGESKRWLISPDALNDWLDNIANERTLIAPRQVGGVLVYRQVAKSDEIAQEPGRPVLSVKEAFFPPTEQLFTIEKTGQQISLSEHLPEANAVVYGVAPCEARGVRLLDALFLDTPPADPYYARRRQNTILIGLACQEMGPTCFCTSVGGAPDEAGDMDIMLHANDGAYLVEAITEKGRFLIPAGEWEKTTTEPKAPVVNPQFLIPDPQSIAWEEHFEDAYWQKMAERCLSCRACAYVCPTCRCFTMRDEVIGLDQFERIRCWESCASENYRRVAGGKRARPEKGERLRNRFFCKFLYYPEQTGLGKTNACTGCGRCIDVCPVGLDITEVLRDLGRPA